MSSAQSIADIFGFDDSKITSAIDALGGLGQNGIRVRTTMSGGIVGGAMSAGFWNSPVYVSAWMGCSVPIIPTITRWFEEYNRLNGDMG